MKLAASPDLTVSARFTMFMQTKRKPNVAGVTVISPQLPVPARFRKHKAKAGGIARYIFRTASP